MDTKKNLKATLFGEALQDYWQNKPLHPLLIETSYGDTEEMPVELFFRPWDEFTPFEQIALDFAKDKILDIGAGAGAHSLYLQQQEKDVTALEAAPGAVEILRQRGVEKIVEADIFDYTGEKFDTLLLLMNGIGLAGKIDGLKELLPRLKNLISQDGIILFDSSDISYLYEGSEMPEGKYYGEISYRYVYGPKKGEWFDWLYVDKVTMAEIAEEAGFSLDILFEDETAQYLGILQLKEN
jgi:SAM-dependent methyltransferase